MEIFQVGQPPQRLQEPISPAIKNKTMIVKMNIFLDAFIFAFLKLKITIVSIEIQNSKPVVNHLTK
jgi:hypothetical protein